MTIRVIHLHPAAPPKPETGTACNGCGVCCSAEPCPLGYLAGGRPRRACPALRWDEAAARYRCGLVAAPREVLRWLPRRLAPRVARWASRRIAAGRGCDSASMTEPLV